MSGVHIDRRTPSCGSTSVVALSKLVDLVARLEALDYD